MAFKLKASKKTEEILTQLESSTKIPYATLIKLSISLSLKQGKLEEDDYKTNTLGRELNRQTITGDADALYKCLFEITLTWKPQGRGQKRLVRLNQKPTGAEVPVGFSIIQKRIR